MTTRNRKGKRSSCCTFVCLVWCSKLLGMRDTKQAFQGYAEKQLTTSQHTHTHTHCTVKLTHSDYELLCHFSVVLYNNSFKSLTHYIHTVTLIFKGHDIHRNLRPPEHSVDFMRHLTKIPKLPRAR